ncbi:hypothetical protein O0L34_g8103 [Tuta absoluta]|nr:hypothetical protein O0L34_g8103 [Tuta absoluta]
MRSYCVKWLLGLWLISYFHNSNIDCKNSPQTPTESQVEVRAVFINCEASGRQDNTDSSSQRFERQELFKHNALRSCNKKLALTVKIASGDPAHGEHAQEGTDGDEYIPIDHVFDGSDRKRVRLLNPYILRLRRELPKQAYKLHRIDTVSGILTNTYLARQIDTNIDDRQVSKTLISVLSN